jgi:glycosyltransferase involved in cell wall biosynthesis
MKISAVISAYNEEKVIKDCLKSVDWVDEIIFIDNQSQDRTLEIAEKFTDNIFSRPNNPLMLNLNKNFGFAKARGDWILSLDADERISNELKDEIIEVLKKDTKDTNGYLIPRKNIIFGKWIKHGIWHPDHQLRLFRRGKGKFPGKHNHELAVIKGSSEKLVSPIIHFNYSSVNQYLKKLTYYYSENEVKQFIKSGKKIQWYDAIRMPASDFLLNFFAREGYKDGLHGLALSILQSFYMFVVFLKIWEKQGFWEYNNEDFLTETKKEMSLKGKELLFWINKVRIENAPKLTKLFAKIKNRMLS